MSQQGPPGPVGAPRAGAEDLYTPFDTALTTNLDDTVRNLRLNLNSADEARWRFKAVSDLTAEVRELRREMGNMVRALDKKASLASQTRFEAALAKRIERRIDTIRTVGISAIGLMLVVDGLIKVVH